MGKAVKGYKVFNPDWTCRGFKYTVGETFEEEIELSVCNRGFHFCEKAIDCFNYYAFNPENKVAEVLALGDIVTKGDKSCTNKIQIVREIPWAELLEIVNTGKGCSGNRNSGNFNSGNFNSGHCNSGNFNSGNYNSGKWNSGDYNIGNCNTGNCNSGNANSGNRNSGDYNSGNWNKCNFSNGCFNTVEPKIYLFNKPSEWTYVDWMNSAACEILNRMPNGILDYIKWSDMTDKEKNAHPEAETTGGYLKKSNNSECNIKWWSSLSDKEKAVITAIPNFDKEIFKQITGIDVEYTNEENANEQADVVWRKTLENLKKTHEVDEFAH